MALSTHRVRNPGDGPANEVCVIMEDGDGDFPPEIVYGSVEVELSAETPSQPLETGIRVVDSRIVQPVSVNVVFYVPRNECAAVEERLRNLFDTTKFFAVFSSHSSFRRLLFENLAWRDDGADNYDVKEFTASFKQAMTVSTAYAGMRAQMADYEPRRT